jgi:VIT1/CCC1 family predicted Fe2+/Mn2+ transporter
VSERVDLSEHDHGDTDGLNNRLNWLRAGVLGANDGVVSIAGLVMGVAAASDDRSAILIAGTAALVAGALSMATGEYVSVSTQRDAELALIDAEKRDLERMPSEELDHMTQILVDKGMSPQTAREGAIQISEHDALRTHVELEFGIDMDDVTNAWGAAIASMLAFSAGGILPLLTILLPSPARFFVTAVTVTVALAITGWSSANLGGARPWPAVARNVLGGVFAMGITLLVGSLLGAQIG